jgi:hypothetical protein
MRLAPSFTIGCRAFHPDLSINYQPNRFCEARPTSVTELTAAAPRITGYADDTRELLALSDSPERITMPALTGHDLFIGLNVNQSRIGSAAGFRHG